MQLRAVAGAGTAEDNSMNLAAPGGAPPLPERAAGEVFFQGIQPASGVTQKLMVVPRPG